jgi:Putative zinc- or iron-chelating domain
MKKETNNVCAACGISQNCCTNLSGLSLSKVEFERNFLRHHESLLINESHGIYEVCGRWKGCPNWDDNNCTVYRTRPMECRLFPYTIGDVIRIGRLIVLTYHHRTLCPQKKRLLPSRAEARFMLRSFAEEAFGPELWVIIIPDAILVRFARFLKRSLFRIVRTFAGAVNGTSR